MSKRGPRYPMEEYARRGQEIYERDIKPTLRPEDDGKFIAIDIESGMYEMDRDEHAAVDRLYERRADAQPWMVRAGHVAAHRMGMRLLNAPPRTDT